MKTNKLGLFLAITLCVSFITGCMKDDQHKTVRELNEFIIELPEKSPLTYSDQFIKELKNWHNYEVIGLGESAHGAREFFELKHRLFKYLVENEEFKVLAYEFNFRTSLKIDRYITEGIGELDSLFSGEMWIQDNYEVQDLVKWMRNYNESKKENEKIHFIGVDNQLDAFYPEKTLEGIKNYFPEIIAENKDIVQEIIELEHIRYKHITTPEYERRRDLYAELLIVAQAYFDDKHEYVETQDYKITIQLVESLIRSNYWLYNIYTGKENNRDSDMANNVLWVKNTFNSKVALWAHTSHVQNNPTYYGANGMGSTGYYLKKTFGENYLIVSTAFTNGTVKAVMEGSNGKDTPPLDCKIIGDPLPGSINEIFSEAKYKNFFVDISQLKKGSQLYSYLDTIRTLFGIGDFYAGALEPHYLSPDRKIILLNATDLVFYFSNVNQVNVHERFKKNL